MFHYLNWTSALALIFELPDTDHNHHQAHNQRQSTNYTKQNFFLFEEFRTTAWVVTCVDEQLFPVPIAVD